MRVSRRSSRRIRRYDEREETSAKSRRSHSSSYIRVLVRCRSASSGLRILARLRARAPSSISERSADSSWRPARASLVARSLRSASARSLRNRPRVPTCTLRKYKRAPFVFGDTDERTLINFNEPEPRGRLGGSIPNSVVTCVGVARRIHRFPRISPTELGGASDEEEEGRERKLVEENHAAASRAFPRFVSPVVDAVRPSRGPTFRATRGRPLARALGGGLREENPTRRRHLRRGEERGHPAAKRALGATESLGTAPTRATPAAAREGNGGGPGWWCVDARKRKRARGRASERASERERDAEGESEGAPGARSREFRKPDRPY